MDGRQNRLYNKDNMCGLKNIGFLWIYLRPARPLATSSLAHSLAYELVRSTGSKSSVQEAEYFVKQFYSKSKSNLN